MEWTEEIVSKGFALYMALSKKDLLQAKKMNIFNGMRKGEFKILFGK